MDIKSEVARVLTDWVLAKKEFSAYDVTLELRKQFPNVTLMHVDVRPLVHDAMHLNVIPAGLYTLEDKTWPDGQVSGWYKPQAQLPPVVITDDDDDALPSNKGVTVWTPNF